MWLPTQAQVNTAGRYALTIAATAIGLFGLQAKGVSIDQIKALIQAAGDAVNNIVIVVSTIAALYAAVRGVRSSSDASQADAVGATGAKVVTTPEIAAATNSPNVVSSADVKVVPK